MHNPQIILTDLHGGWIISINTMKKFQPRDNKQERKHINLSALCFNKP